MAKRKPLSKKIRFEVFKKDNFTCQYCGSKAPDVILEVDHIKPVAEGGDNDLLNLVTSCFSCNRGKSKRLLKDNSVLEKQRLKIEELNIRRQQLEMMLEWRNGLTNNNEFEANKTIDYFNNKFVSISLNEKGKSVISKFVDKYGVIKIMDTIDLCKNKYEGFYDDDQDLANKVLDAIPKFITLENKPEYVKRIAYLRGILRNKFRYINDKKYYTIMTEAYKKGIDLEDLIRKAKADELKHWSYFSDMIEEFNSNN